MSASEAAAGVAPRLFDLDRCIHCGLCLNACPTYRELGLEMDSPRGRIYQMVQVTEGKRRVDASYIRHIDLCWPVAVVRLRAPQGCSMAGWWKQRGRRLRVSASVRRWSSGSAVSRFSRLLPSRGWLQAAGALLYLYQASGLRRAVRTSGVLRIFGRLYYLEALAPHAHAPFFFRNIGKVFPAQGEVRYRVGFLAGCIANVSFARLNEATIRVLQANGCEVTVPAGQTCCGALHVHSGLREEAHRLARRNIDAFLEGGFDAIITNAAGCGSTLKEYGELLEDDPAYAERAKRFASMTKDVTEFLASIELNRDMGPVDAVVTYQDSCHLAHG